MVWFDSHFLLLAVIQGLTEFLPVSSSAHLVLAPQLLGFADQGLACDVALHFGTLLAVLFYFRQDLKQLLMALPSLFQKSRISTASHEERQYVRLLWTLLIAIIPICIAGLLLNDWISTHLRSPKVIAGSTLFFAVLLWVSDKQQARIQDEKSIPMLTGFIIGLMQALALIPGTSRSGITLTASRFLGLSREAGARFSFLLSIPVISLATLYEGYKLFKTGTALPMSLLSAVLVAGLVGFLCIRFLLKILTRFGVWPFVVYRLLLGCILLYMFCF